MFLNQMGLGIPWYAQMWLIIAGEIWAKPRADPGSQVIGHTWPHVNVEIC